MTHANRRLAVLVLVALVSIFLSNIFFLSDTPLAGKSGSGNPSGHWSRILELVSWFIIATLLPWAALLALILHFLRRRPWTGDRPARFILLHFSVCFLFSLGQFLVHALIEPDSGLYFGDFTFRLVLGQIDYLGRNIIFYAAVVAIHQALTFFHQLRQKDIDHARLAESLAEARLSSLKMKFQPHFLFNALQSLNVLILDRQMEPASEMTVRLGSLLRRSIDMDDRQWVNVASEMAAVGDYLAIEEIRFRDRLEVRTTVDPAVQKAMIPGLIFQPLVENAVKHGLARSVEPGKIDIDVRREGDKLVLSIRNDGPGLPEGWALDRQTGFGLRATKKRLELMVGRDFTLEVRNAPEGGVRASIILPYAEEVLTLEKAGRP